MGNSAGREKLVFIFQGFFASIDKGFHFLVGRERRVETGDWATIL